MELDSRDASHVYRRLARFLRAESLKLEAGYPDDDAMQQRASDLAGQADYLNDMANQLWEAKANLRG